MAFYLFLACSSLYTPASGSSSFLPNASKTGGIDTTVPATLNLAKAKKIEFLSIRKETGKSGSDPEHYKKQCTSWVLTRSQLGNIIRKFKQVSSESQYLGYSVTGCEMKGKIKIDNIEFTYWINAGATLTLLHKDTYLYYGYPGKDWRRFFITGELGPKELRQ